MLKAGKRNPTGRTLPLGVWSEVEAVESYGNVIYIGRSGGHIGLHMPEAHRIARHGRARL